MKPKSKNYTLTVTMTDRPPIRIRTEDWPVISYAGGGDGRWIVTRRCRATGTVIVSAVNQSVSPERRVGLLVDPNSNPVPSIRTAASLAEVGDDLAREAVACLPAEDFTPTTAGLARLDWDRFFTDMHDAADAIGEDYPSRAGVIHDWAARISTALDEGGVR